MRARGGRSGGAVRAPRTKSPTVSAPSGDRTKALGKRKQADKVTFVTFQPGKPRGKPFRRGEDSRRTGGDVDAEADAPSPTAVEAAASVLASGFMACDTPRKLTGAEKVRRVEGRELAALQTRARQLQREGLSGTKLRRALAEGSGLSVSGVAGALKRAAVEAKLSPKSFARRRFDQRGGRPRVLTDEDYEVAAVAARTRPSAAVRTALAAVRARGSKVGRSTLRRYMKQGGFKKRPAVDYDPLTPQVRSHACFPGPR